MFSIKELINKKILIYGFGKTGKSVKKYFDSNCIKYSIWDDNKKINLQNVNKNFLEKKYDFIILSPGIDIYHHKYKSFFKKNKNKIITDLDIFFSNIAKCNYVIGVTGTNGKSGFCNLLKKILDKNKINSKIIGNFGNPVLNIKNFKNQYIIVELSSYQLDYSKYLQLDVACILNISPDHLERHDTMSRYKGIKLKIFKFLKNNGKGFFLKRSFKIKKKRNIKGFLSINKKLLNDIIGKKVSISDKDIKENNLKHRNEFFFKKKNFKFINDSKSTNFNSTRFAIKKFENIFLILGGILKKGDNFFIKDLMYRIKKVYIFGNQVNSLKKSLINQNIQFYHCKSLKEVIKIFYEIDYYKNIQNQRDSTLLFSPGGASFDEFENYEKRGLKFKKYIYEFFERK